MPLTISSIAIPTFERALGGLANCLATGEAYCAEKKVDPTVLLGCRLYPNMFAFTRQVQVAADFVKGPAARLAGLDVPSWPDEEKTFAELSARLAKTTEFLKSIPTAALDAGEDRTVTITVGGNPMSFVGKTYLVEFVIPNLNFHASMAYAILRHNGVDVGKRDYLWKM